VVSFHTHTKSDAEGKIPRRISDEDVKIRTHTRIDAKVNIPRTEVSGKQQTASNVQQP
jgi:hypothetical protein